MSDRRAVTRLIAGLARADRGAVTRIAALTSVDRTTVSHWLSADDGARPYSVPSDHLAAVCDALDSVEPLRSIADELGLDLVPKARPTACARPVQDAVWDLLGRTSVVGTEVADAARDGKIDIEEARKLRAALQNLRDITDAMLSRLPREGS